jgi:DNA-binding NarL/FixJ family response regulator
MEKRPRSTPKSSPKTPSADGDRSVPPVRVLVVDDYEPFRRFICSTLGKRPDLRVISEAADGLEAVHKVEELKPDLIVLDIGLPTLNGIEAARRIRQLAPESKIVFLSQESSADVVQEALSLGALGYVVKAHAGTDLLSAVEAAIQGTQFISRGLSVPDYTGATDKQIPDHLSRKEPLPSLEPEKGKIERSHAVQFYPDDASFLAGFTRFIEAALNAGSAVIVVATESHRSGLFQRLESRGLNIDAAIEQGSYIPLDVADTLSTFMVNDMPDPVRFRKAAGDLVATAAKAARGENPRVAACGECAPTLWMQGKADAAIQVEHLWDEIAKTCSVDILCGYVLNSFQREQESDIYEKICAEHSAVYSPERTIR